MDIVKIQKNGKCCSVVKSDDVVIMDVQSALDLLISVQCNTETDNIAIHKNLITENFFKLSTGLAGEILQKYVNYGGRIAIYGDFSHYNSKPLKDFIYESNNGKDVFFVTTENDAIDILTR